MEEKDGHTGVASFLKGESENYSFLDAYYKGNEHLKKHLGVKDQGRQGVRLYKNFLMS